MNKANHLLSLLILLLGLLAAGCQQHKSTDQRPTWERFSFNNEQLVGVRVQQHPDNGDIESHRGKHPAMVLYVIRKKNENRVCQVEFSPDGEVESLFWWGPPEEWLMEQLQPLSSQE